MKNYLNSTFYLFCTLFFLNNCAAQHKWEFAIYFDSGSSTISTELKDSITSTLNCLNEKRIYSIELRSYTDTIGDIEYNNKLSDSRLKSSLELINSINLNEGYSITTGSFGEKKGERTQALSINRVVELVVFTFDIEEVAGMNLVSLKVPLSYNKKDFSPCNQYIQIENRVTKEYMEALPFNKESTIYTISTLFNDSLYKCFGHVFYFEESNYSIKDSIGWFDKSIFLSERCGSSYFDSLKFNENYFSPRYDEIDRGYYIYIDGCSRYPACCGTRIYCYDALLLEPSLNENTVVTTYRDSSIIYDSTLNDSITQFYNSSEMYFDKFSYSVKCRTDSIRLLVKLNGNFWKLDESIKTISNNTSFQLIDSLENKEEYKKEIKDSYQGKRAYIKESDLERIKFTEKKIVVVNKGAIAGGTYLPYFQSFIPLDKKWFNRFKGREMKDIQYVIAVKRGKKLLKQEDFYFKKRENKRKIKYKLKSLKPIDY